MNRNGWKGPQERELILGYPTQFLIPALVVELVIMWVGGFCREQLVNMPLRLMTRGAKNLLEIGSNCLYYSCDKVFQQVPLLV